MALVLKQERLTLARAVARSSFVHLLGPDNVAGPGVQLEVAVASGQAYFVTPRRELLVVDVDLPSDSSLTADVLSAFDFLVDAARRAGVPHVSVPSGRPGHQHGYFVVGTGPHRVRLERWCRERRLDVRTAGVRPPGTPHRLSVTTGWAPEVDVRRTVAVLRSSADDAATGRLANQLCPVELPSRILVAVRHGHERAGYASPSHARMALAVAVRARGGGPGLVEAILRDAGSPLGFTFRCKGVGWQRAEIVRIWDKAGAWIAAGGRPDPREHLRRVYATAAQSAWFGAAGGSDLAVLEELVRAAAAVPTTVVGVGLDALAVGAGVGVDTVRAALRRLIGAGWVRVQAQETARTTRTYALLVPAGSVTPNAGGEAAELPLREEFGDLGSDIARRGGLGKASVRVGRWVARRPASSVADIGGALSMTARTVRYHLRKLSAAGLAAYTSSGWVLTALRVHVEDLAAAWGVCGSRERQQAAIVVRRSARERGRATFARWRTGASDPREPLPVPERGPSPA